MIHVEKLNCCFKKVLKLSLYQLNNKVQEHYQGCVVLYYMYKLKGKFESFFFEKFACKIFTQGDEVARGFFLSNATAKSTQSVSDYIIKMY